MRSIPQNIFRPPQNTFPSEIPYHQCPSRDAGWAIDHLTTLQDIDQVITFGVSHHLSAGGELEYLCISTNDRAAIISFTDASPPISRQELSFARLLDVKKYTLVGFNMSRTALYLNARTLLHVRGVDLTAVYRDPKKDSALSAAEIVQKHLSDKADTWKVLRLWNHEYGQLERDLCLQAWLAYHVGSRATGLETMVRVDTAYLNRSELELLTRMVKEIDILDSNQPSERTGDFSSATVDKSGHIKLLNSRYKTRIRTSEHAKIILTDSSGKEHWGNAAAARGKTTTIALQNRPVGDLKFDKVRVYGRSAALNHEKARDTLVIHLLTRVKSLRDAPFIRALWFPKWKPTFFIRGGGAVSAAQAEILLRGVRLNDSQKRAALSMISEDPIVIVHGPPGTGKTTTISASAKVWQAHRRPTWIVAHSNVAVKNIAASLFKHSVEFKLIVSKDFHFEWHEHLYKQISERTIRSDDFNEDPRLTASLFNGIHIVLCTLSMLSNPVLSQCGLLTIVRLERLVIDEASQINAFEYLNIFDKYSQTLEKVCFFGDPHQLPPFGKTDAPTIQTIFDFKDITPCDHFLDTQYRMPTPIGGFISCAVYNGRLKSQHPITSSDCVKFIDVQSCEEKAGFSWKNAREADLIVHLVKNYYSAMDFCIITPYDAQRALIHASLERSNLRSDTVFNLDSFQGNEADYILISVVRTSKPGFLTSLERLNVLLTRAKKGLVIVTNNSFLKAAGSSTLLGKLSQHWQRKYPSPSPWVDWRLVAQNQASLPGAFRTAARPTNSRPTGTTLSPSHNGPGHQPRAFSVKGPSIGRNLLINDPAQWPQLSGSHPAAPRPPQWPIKPVSSFQTTPQVKKKPTQTKTYGAMNNNKSPFLPIASQNASYYHEYNSWAYNLASRIATSPPIPGPNFSYGLYHPQMKVKPRVRSSTHVAQG